MSQAELTWSEIAGLAAEDAAALIIDRAERSPPEVSEALIDRWLAESDANRWAWSKARDAWDRFEGWEMDGALVAMREEALSLSFGARRQRWLSMSLAASVAIVAGAGVLALSVERWPFDGGASRDAAEVANGRYASEAGERRTFALADGTKATLEGGSAIEATYTATARVVRLSHGKATFDVASAPTRPFRVFAGGRTIADLGTIFSVEHAGSRLRVSLIHGRVSVFDGEKVDIANASRSFVLAPGDTFEADSSGARVVSGGRAPLQEASDRILLKEEPLATAIERMNEGSSVKVVAHPRLRDLRISGSFRAADSARFARVVADLYSLRVRRQPDGSLILLPRNGR
ncbi:FecR family protein [Sphingomonas sp. S2-65]|uniref:FecR family protein n=1 Tax=Sphingomonas sp. S2-65 TaxID=2903960 RepID=UPI001F2E510D|nr:FecR domain-containing protein [Sphingomonas sp. S2-65]UYY58032.1 FecR domain-containing protein [Sphingomonas sp. S2-65]